MVNDTLFPEEALVEIWKKDDAIGTNITTDIDSFEESGFEREVETRPFFHNAKVSITQQQADGEISVNAKVTRALWDQMLWGATGSDFTSGGTQSLYRLTFLVTKDPDYTTFNAATTLASGVIDTGYDTYRKIYANARLTSFNPGLEVEGMLEGEAVFAISPVDESADPNIRVQIGSLGFPAVGSYTTAQKWTA